MALPHGVPQCIEQLMRAGIAVWVLTGDKQDTAINIGQACSLLRDDMAGPFTAHRPYLPAFHYLPFLPTVIYFRLTLLQTETMNLPRKNWSH